MRGNLSMINMRGMENIFGKMVNIMMGNLKMMLWKVKELSIMKMEK